MSWELLSRRGRVCQADKISASKAKILKEQHHSNLGGMLLLRYAHTDVWNVIESRNQFGDKELHF